ncbi:sugar transferase [Bradyrhizobium sp. WSM1417]|uniref:sugar transferase n=1 Tax=Bradyrhizobium sp. WSM1417 TaxID=754500 RepID=UPI0004824362|nr:sugar transferase [Bradyrhizobium sp. WSM1417]
MASEPTQAFPHLAPTQAVRESYGELFLDHQVPNRPAKEAFDRLVGGTVLLAVAPVVLAIAIAHAFLATILPSERGPLLISYTAVSRGLKFQKYKFRVVRRAHVDSAAALARDWHAYAAEWDPARRTLLGHVLKKFYLDEIPQLINVVLGNMSLVGPRPLALHHYERDCAQGNIQRAAIKAGLFGPSQALKGTPRYGEQDDEYKYLHAMKSMPPGRLILYDLRLIGLGMLRVAQGKGL